MSVLNKDCLFALSAICSDFHFSNSQFTSRVRLLFLHTWLFITTYCGVFFHWVLGNVLKACLLTAKTYLKCFISLSDTYILPSSFSAYLFAVAVTGRNKCNLISPLFSQALQVRNSSFLSVSRSELLPFAWRPTHYPGSDSYLTNDAYWQHCPLPQQLTQYH